MRAASPEKKSRPFAQPLRWFAVAADIRRMITCSQVFWECAGSQPTIGPRSNGQLGRTRGKLSSTIKFGWHDVAEILVGASVLAIPVAYTEEVWVLGEQLPWLNVWAVAASSIGFVALFVYFIYYKKKMERDKWQFLLRVTAGYGSPC